MQHNVVQQNHEAFPPEGRKEERSNYECWSQHSSRSHEHRHPNVSADLNDILTLPEHRLKSTGIWKRWPFIFHKYFSFYSCESSVVYLFHYATVVTVLWHTRVSFLPFKPQLAALQYVHVSRDLTGTSFYSQSGQKQQSTYWTSSFLSKGLRLPDWWLTYGQVCGFTGVTGAERWCSRWQMDAVRACGLLESLSLQELRLFHFILL